GRKKLRAMGGQAQPSAHPLKERDTQRLFQRLDLVADRSMRDIEFARRARQRTRSTRCLKSAEGIEGWKSFCHRAIRKCEVCSHNALQQYQLSFQTISRKIRAQRKQGPRSGGRDDR